MSALLQNHYARMVVQLVDSELESTRVFWREKLGATPEQAIDPRSFSEVISNLSNAPPT